MGIKHCRLKKRQQVKLLEYFVLAVTARVAADLIGTQANTTTLFYNKVRAIIAEKLETDSSKQFIGEMVFDEDYFDDIHANKQDQDIAEKTPIFGMLVRAGKIYTQVVDPIKIDTSMPKIQQKITPHSIVYTDSYFVPDTLSFSSSKYFMINNSKLSANKADYIKSIELFWSKTKRILHKYNGISTENIHLFLKECEFRFNYGSRKQQLITLRRWCGL